MTTAAQNLKNKISGLPKQPGVYQFLDKNDGVIYIGKAKNLRSRVRQYFNGSDERPQIPFLMEEAADFSYTVVNNELESLYLENTLIKQYLPKYNILLRDDKNYAFIKIDYSTEIPQIGYARKIDNSPSPSLEKEGKLRGYPRSPLPFSKGEAGRGSNLKSSIINHKSVFFGPYTAAYKIRDTLHLMRKVFPYCSAVKVTGKPCFYYHLHRCPGVCIGKITLDEYRLTLKKIEDFLAGNTGKISKQLQSEMRIAAGKKQFEKAARLRDQLNSLKLLEERQTVILAKKVDWDIVSMASSDGYACVNLFKVREGKLQDKENFVYETKPLPASPLKKGEENAVTPSFLKRGQGELLQKFLEQYYSEASGIPKIIYIQYQTQEYRLIEKLIRLRCGRAVKIFTPQKGKAKNLIKLGVANAQEYLNKWLSDQAGNLDKINLALQRLKDVLNLPQIPKRIECYDISNIQGTNAVGSMVVFNDGLPAKSQYRKFKICSKSTPDDFAMMQEMLTRRLSRLPSPYGRGQGEGWPTPDLIIIDGGKGQLGIASSIIHNSKFLIPAIGLAKRIEEIFVPGKPDPIILSHDDPALQLLQRLRDEAHRFGITFHRQLRSKQAVRSALDDIPGLGPKTKKLLKQKFGTVTNIRKTSFDNLASAVGEHLARQIQQSL
jgi:excinuclease ABC subunit C